MSDKIKSEDVYLRNPHFRFQWEEAQNCYVLLFPEGMVKLNAGAGEVLHRLQPQKTVALLITELMTAFPDVDGMEADIIGMLELALEKTWIIKETPC